eukprot:27387-Chlamydomonas_euryale.AAC.11
MAKSQRSSAKKAIRRQRRENLKTVEWQQSAEARRYAALAAASESAAVPFHPTPVSTKEEHVSSGRGRAGKAGGGGGGGGAEVMDTDASAPLKRKGVRVAGGIKKKATHNSKKVSALWTSEWAKGRKGKKKKLTLK